MGQLLPLESVLASKAYSGMVRVSQSIKPMRSQVKSQQLLSITICSKRTIEFCLYLCFNFASLGS